MVLAPDEWRASQPGTLTGFVYRHVKKETYQGQIFVQRRRKRERPERNESETYRAEVDAPPQLDAVEIEVAIAPQRKIDLVVYDSVSFSGVLLAGIQF
jgi:hypothetical protein